MSATLDALLQFRSDAASSSSSSASQPASAHAAAADSHFIRALFTQLVATTKQANALPDTDDCKYLNSTSPDFVTESTRVSQRIGNLLGLVTDAVMNRNESSVEHNKKNGTAEAATGSSLPLSHSFTGRSTDSLSQFHYLTDVLDHALEQVDLALDVHRGVKRGNMGSMGGAADSRNANVQQQQQQSNIVRGFHHKPQKAWAHLIDNSRRSWIPIIRHKPHAIKPLPDYQKLREEHEKKQAAEGQHRNVNTGGRKSMDTDEHAPAAPSSEALLDLTSSASPSPKLSPAMSSHIANLGAGADSGSNSSSSKASPTMSPTSSSSNASAPIYPHPYQHEIENFDYDAIRSSQLSLCKETLYEPLQKTPCTWVDNVESLQQLADELEQVNEIAIDLEHHNYRSYQGFTCLMQISTRSADYLIDTLVLREEMHRLNSSFTNPRIVKVLHGADSDIIWLQRDFGLYLVNLFDTGQASRILEFPSFGLAYLLKHYCDVVTDKKYQLADWRIRPLSGEMLLYARMDTHYLLYIYDRLKNSLVQKSSQTQNALSPIPGVSFHLAQVLERSRALTLKTYEKDAALDYVSVASEFAYKQGIAIQNDMQQSVLVNLFALRDELARQEDESWMWMCSNANMAAIVRTMPNDERTLQSICKPIPPLVRQYAGRVLAVIEEAKKKAASGALSSSLTSPFLASTLPPLTVSPQLQSQAATEPPSSSMMLDLTTAANIQTPIKSTGKQMLGGATVPMTGAAGLPPLPTPATVASSLFAALSTSSPHPPATAHWLASSDVLIPSHPSPVLSTDSLYSAANWIAASRNLERSMATLKGDEQQHDTPMKPSFTASMSPPSKGSVSAIAMLLSNTQHDSKDAVQNRASIAQAQAAILASGMYSSNMATLATPLKATTAAADGSSTNMMDDDDRTALRTPITGEPGHSFVSPSPASLLVAPSPVPIPYPASAAGGHSSFTSIARDVAPSMSSNHESAGSASGSSGVGVVSAALAAATNNTSSSSGGNSPLPKSMREIFKISNDNRRKKKKKVSHHGSNAGGAGAGAVGVDGDDGDEGAGGGGGSNPSTRPPSAAGHRKGSSSSSSLHKDAASDYASSQEFLKEIGWMNGQSGASSSSVPHPDNKKRKHSSAPSSGAASVSSSPPSNSPVLQPFNYANATLHASLPAHVPHFDPTHDFGRDKSELKAAAGTAPQSRDPNQRITKGLNQLKGLNKSVTVRMDDHHQHHHSAPYRSHPNDQRQRGGSANSGLPNRH